MIQLEVDIVGIHDLSHRELELVYRYRDMHI